MISLNFPPIHKSVVVDKKNPQNIKNYVHVKNGVGIVIATHGVFCFDLKNFFIDSQLVQESEKLEFEELFSFLEGKSFTPEFWESLTKGDSIKVLDHDYLNIQNDKIQKNLLYEYPSTVSIQGVLDTLKKNFINHGAKGAVKNAINTLALKQFLKGFEKIIQSNSIIFEHTVDDSVSRFTVCNLPYIFGLIQNDFASTQKQFIFDMFSDFVKECNQVPAPPIPQEMPKPVQLDE